MSDNYGESLHATSSPTTFIIFHFKDVMHFYILENKMVAFFTVSKSELGNMHHVYCENEQEYKGRMYDFVISIINKYTINLLQFLSSCFFFVLNSLFHFNVISTIFFCYFISF